MKTRPSLHLVDPPQDLVLLDAFESRLFSTTRFLDLPAGRILGLPAFDPEAFSRHCSRDGTGISWLRFGIRQDALLANAVAKYLATVKT